MPLAADTWAIPGPLFAVGYAAAWLIVIVMYSKVSRRDAESRSYHPLSPDEIGYANAGPARAVQAATAEAVARGALRRFGERWYAPNPHNAATPLQAAVTAWMAGQRSGRMLRDSNVRRALTQTRAALEAKGAWYSVRAQRLRALLHILMVALVILGFLRIGAGSQNGKPVGILIGILCLGALLALALVYAWRLPAQPWSTEGNKGIPRPPMSTGSAAALAVAMSGAASLALIDAGLPAAMGSAGTARGWGAAGGSSDGGSSGCGGGSGGGGCGGGCGG